VPNIWVEASAMLLQIIGEISISIIFKFVV